MSMLMCSKYHLVTHLGVRLPIVFYCTMKVCLVQNSDTSIWVKKKLKQFIIVLIITFVRVGSMNHQVNLGIPSLLYEKRMVSCIWWLIIQLSIHGLCLTGILFLALMICWRPSIVVPTLLRLVYSLGIIRVWWKRRIAIKQSFSCIRADTNTI